MLNGNRNVSNLTYVNDDKLMFKLNLNVKR